MGSLLALDYPDYEVVAVDDRSADGTRERLEAIASGDPRLRVVRVDELPAGWLGKCHALDRGARAAKGDWLLFTDADVRFAPATLRIAMRRAIEGELDLLSLMPHNETRSVWMRAFYIAATFALIVFLGFWAHSTRRQSLLASSAGAFALVRRRTYEQAGGHEALRLALIDDMELGALIRHRGGRTEVAMGMDWIRVPWSTSVPQLFRVVRKNGFAAFNFSWLVLGAFSLGTIVLSLAGPFCGLVEPALWPWTAALWIALADVYVQVGRLVGASPVLVVLHPAVSAISMLATWNSAFWIWWEGGVRWRGTLYPLASLKRWR
jgi:glycosyltransferase involved in cell wall biosynthesis